MKKIIVALFICIFCQYAGVFSDFKEEKKMKTLVVFYSRTGNTELVAKTVAQVLNADLRRVEEVKERKGIFTLVAGCFKAIKNKSSDIKPVDFNLGNYDLIFLGSPVWASKTTPAINTFISKADFKNKNVVVFFTLGGTNYKGAVKDMTEKIEKKEGKVIGSFAIRSSKAKEEMINKTKEAVKEYAK